jgi:subtilisin family serine protease
VSPADRPEWSRDSGVLRLDGVADLRDIGPEWAWGGSAGAGVRVAVVDSGIDADHPALGGRVDAEAGVEVRLVGDRDVELVPGAHADAYGHGTACAGIIHQLAPDAELVSVKVLGANLGGKAVQFAAGFRWAVEQRFDVINLSLGTRRADWALTFHELCDEAYFQGVLVVAAANNVQLSSFPSMYASVISVACNTATDPERFHYNPDPPTEFLARGIEIDVPWRGGGHETVTGNSFAAPHISGLAARVLGKHKGLRPFQVKTALWAAAANVLEAPTVAGRITRTIAGRPPPGRSGVLRALRWSPPIGAPRPVPSSEAS